MNASPVAQNRLHDLYSALQSELAAKLKSLRAANPNAEAKGEASEKVWNDLLRDHIPHRYQLSKGFVIDAGGQESQFIDIIVHDRQYTPLIFNREGNLYIPAESVYAVLEAKQNLSKEHLEYAGDKAQSVRRLRRTSARITHAGGRLKAKKPFPILAGILAYESSWSPPFGKPFRNAITEAPTNERLDLGIAVEHGCFDVKHGRLRPKITEFSAERALAAFILRLLARLQDLGTVPAIDYKQYGRLLED